MQKRHDPMVSEELVKTSNEYSDTILTTKENYIFKQIYFQRQGNSSQTTLVNLKLLIFHLIFHLQKT